MQAQTLFTPKRVSNRKSGYKLTRHLPFDRNDYLNSKEIADLLQIGYVAIHRAAWAGEFLEPVKVSQRKHYWKKDDVFEWIANNQDSFLVRNLNL